MMIVQANSVLPLIILVFGLTAKNSSSIIFGLVSLFYAFLFHDLPGEYGGYYIMGASLADFFIIKLVSRLDEPDIILQRLTKWFIYINLFGWVCWMSYISVKLYNFMCFILFVIIAIRTVCSGGTSKLDNRRSIFSMSDYPSLTNMRRNPKDQRTC